MPRFRVTGQMTISVSVVVEADTKAQAREKAEQLSAGSLCLQCSSERDGEWMPSGLDGEPDLGLKMDVERVE